MSACVHIGIVVSLYVFRLYGWLRVYIVVCLFVVDLRPSNI